MRPQRLIPLRLPPLVRTIFMHQYPMPIDVPRLHSARWVVAVLLGWSLWGCGGGSAIERDAPEEEAPPAPLQTSSLQGRWTAPAGATSAHTLLVLPSATDGTAAVWAITADGQALLRLQMQATGAHEVELRGWRHVLGEGQMPSTVAWQGTAALTTGSASMTFEAGTLAFTRVDPLDQPPRLADIGGSWSATLGEGAVVLHWSVDASGRLSGSSTTGCTYSGMLQENSHATLFDTTLIETCQDLARKFAGIASPRPAMDGTVSGMTLALVQEDGGAALLLALRR